MAYFNELDFFFLSLSTHKTSKQWMKEKREEKKEYLQTHAIITKYQQQMWILTLASEWKLMWKDFGTFSLFFIPSFFRQKKNKN